MADFKTKNILIVFSVLENLGDFGLNLALVQLIRQKYNNPNITIACNKPDLEYQEFNGVNFIYSFEKSTVLPDGLLSALLIKTWLFLCLKLNRYHWIYWLKFLKTKNTLIWLEIMRNSDEVYCSPGGYIHDLYDPRFRLKVLELLLDHDKTVKIIGHSLGPFYRKSTISIFKRILPNIKKIYVREKNSQKIILDTFGICPDLIYDLALSLDLSSYPQEKKIPNSICLNFRQWEDQATTQKIIVNATILVNHLISNWHYKVYFLSTCQGKEHYVDDSVIASKIVNNLNHSANEITIIKSDLEFKDYIKCMSQFEFYMGMRLHGSLYALLLDVPSICIGYEKKSSGIYETLNLSDFEFHYSEDISLWLEKLELLLKTKTTNISYPFPDRNELKLLIEEKYHQS